MPDNFPRCLGKDSDGEPCICTRCTKTYVVGEQTLCSNCGHIESAHPEPPVVVGALIRKFRDAGRLGNVPTGSSSSSTSPTKATQSEAEAETSNGLRKKRKSDTDTEPPSKNASSKVSPGSPRFYRI